MKRAVEKYINFTVFFALAVLLLYYAFRSVDFKHIARGFESVNYPWIFVAIATGLVAHILRAIRWGVLIEPLGKKVPFSNLFGAVMVGYLANVAFPRLGEVAKCGSIRKTDGVKLEALVGTVVVERAVDLLMLFIFTLTAIAIKIDIFGEFMYARVLLPLKERVLQVNGYRLAAILLALLAAGVLLGYAVERGLLGRKLSGKLRLLYRGVVDGLRSITKTHRMTQFLALSVLIWIFYWAMTWALFYSTPITSSLTAGDALFIMVIGSYGMVVPVQGGFGAFHIMTAVALGVFGITYDDGLIFAIISHGSQTLFLILGGLAALAYLYVKQRRQPGVDPQKAA